MHYVHDEIYRALHKYALVNGRYDVHLYMYVFGDLFILFT